MNDTWWLDQSELDEAQAAVIELPADGNYLIKGPPGSGKTNLLLLRAKFLALLGLANVRVVVLTRSLRHFLASGASKYALRPDQVVTSRWLYGDFLKNHGLQPERRGSYDDTRRADMDGTLEIVRRGGTNLTYDAIILDEGQDYLHDDYEILRAITPRLIVAADSQQRIYNTNDGVAAFQALARVIQLEAHYRNGLEICRLADAVALPTSDALSLVESSNYNENERPSSVAVYRAPTLQQQCAKIIELISVEQKAYPGELVGVLVPSNEDLLDVLDELQQSQLAASVAHVKEDEAFQAGAKTIFISTIHSAKGLEFRTVHLVAMDNIAGFTNERNLVFTAITRAKTTLTIHHSGPLPLYLESAIKRAQPRPAPALSDLFRGGL